MCSALKTILRCPWVAFQSTQLATDSHETLLGFKAHASTGNINMIGGDF